MIKQGILPKPEININKTSESLPENIAGWRP